MKRYSKKLSTFKIVGIILAISQALLCGYAQAATFVVNTGIDGPQGCSLRGAIEQLSSSNAPRRCLNRQPSEPLGVNNTILFSVSTVTGISSEIPIARSVAINPNGERVSIIGTNTSRIFSIASHGVSLNNLNLSQGNAGNGAGGAINILLNSQVTLNNTVISNNTADQGGGIAVNRAELVLNNSQVINNSSTSGGGIFITTPLLDRASQLTLNNSLVQQNNATRDGGGILAIATNLTLNNSLLEGNTASSAFVNSPFDNVEVGGGAIHVGSNIFAVVTSTLNVNNSTLSDNSTDRHGGAIHAISTDVNCNSSTLVNNTAMGSFGGGAIFTNSAPINLSNCLVSNNQAIAPGNDIKIFGTGQINFNGTNLLGDGGKTSEQAFSGFTPPQTQIIATSNGNQPTPADAIFQPLADNGGPTPTHALAENSPAIDTAGDSLCNAFNQDQRGENRIFGERCDIGAYEFQVPEDSFYVIPLPTGKPVVIVL